MLYNYNMSTADSSEDEADLVFKALGDRRRRRILDVLRAGPQTTGDLCALLAGDLDRCTVMQHIGVLEKAGLLIGVREGRQRWNHLNIAPVQDVHARWIAPYAAEAAGLLHRLKGDLEA